MKTTRKPLMRKKKANNPAPGAGFPQPNVSPQDQAMYDHVMLAARKVIYGEAGDDQRFRMVVDRLKGAQGEIGKAIGQLAATVMSNVQGTIERAGRKVPSYVLFHAGLELIADLVKIAVAAKLMQDAQAGEITQQAVQSAVETYKQAQAVKQPTQPAQVAPQPPQPPQPGIVNAARA